MKKIKNPTSKGLFADAPITDHFGRTFNYVRIAVNEYCNLRCIYCMPEEGVPFQKKDSLLLKDEIFTIIKIMEEMGISKVRFTGGEPLIRKDIIDLIHITKCLHSLDSSFIHFRTISTGCGER